MHETLTRISTDALFNKRACQIKRVPKEDVVAHIHPESRGKPFIFGPGGELNRFQIHLKSLRPFYDHAIKQDDEIAEYVLKNTSPSTLLEVTVSNNNLNAALAISNMQYLQRNAPTYHQAKIAYNMRLEKVLGLSKKFIRKLVQLEKEPERVSMIGLSRRERAAFKYYKGFIEAKQYFKELRSFLRQLTPQDPEVVIS